MRREREQANRLILSHHSRQAKVANFDGVVSIYEKVAQFQISMDNFGCRAVQPVHPCCDEGGKQRIALQGNAPRAASYAISSFFGSENWRFCLIKRDSRSLYNSSVTGRR